MPKKNVVFALTFGLKSFDFLFIAKPEDTNFLLYEEERFNLRIELTVCFRKFILSMLFMYFNVFR